MKRKDYENILLGNNKEEIFHGKSKVKKKRKTPRVNKTALLNAVEEKPPEA